MPKKLSRRDAIRTLSIAAASVPAAREVLAASADKKPMLPSDRLKSTQFQCPCCAFMFHLDDMEQGRLLVEYFKALEDGRMRLIEGPNGIETEIVKGDSDGLSESGS